MCMALSELTLIAKVGPKLFQNVLHLKFKTLIFSIAWNSPMLSILNIQGYVHVPGNILVHVAYSM